MKKLLFLLCFLGLFGMSQAMDKPKKGKKASKVEITPEMISEMQKGRIPEWVKKREWLSIVDSLAESEITAADLIGYSKEEFDQPDTGDKKTFFQHLIFKIHIISHKVFPKRKEALETALSELVEANKITHSLELAENAVPKQYENFKSLGPKIRFYYQSQVIGIEVPTSSPLVLLFHAWKTPLLITTGAIVVALTSWFAYATYYTSGDEEEADGQEHADRKKIAQKNPSKW